jgi:hypothetical protein
LNTLKLNDLTFEVNAVAAQQTDTAQKNGSSGAQLTGALAVAYVGNTVRSVIDTQGGADETAYDIVAGGVSVASKATTASSVTADASAMESSGASTSASVGVGIAVGITNHRNESYIQNARIMTKGISVSAATGSAGLSSSVVSKAGYNGGNVGIGGAVSVHVFNNNTSAVIYASANLTLTGGSLGVSAAGASSLVTQADASGSDTAAGKIGVGAGIAVAVTGSDVFAAVADGTPITIQDGAVVDGFSVTANSESEGKTSAKAGAKGGIAITPVLALDVAGSNAVAYIGSGADLDLAGDLDVFAGNRSLNDVAADAAAAGGSVAVGASIAVSVINDSARSKLNRSVKAQNISVDSSSESSHTSESKASARGSKTKSAASTTTTTTGDGSSDGGSGDSGSPDGLTTGALTTGNTVAAGFGTTKSTNKNNVPTKNPQKPQTSEGTVSVAAGINVAIVINNSYAVLPSGLEFTAAAGEPDASVKPGAAIFAADAEKGGKISVTAANTTVNEIKAAASAVGTGGAKDVGVGAAVAIGVTTYKAQASVGNSAITADDLRVKAEMARGDSDDTVLAKGVNTGKIANENPSYSDANGVTRTMDGNTRVEDLGDIQKLEYKAAQWQTVTADDDKYDSNSHSFLAQTVSGAGACNTGVAGSLGIQVVVGGFSALINGYSYDESTDTYTCSDTGFEEPACDAIQKITVSGDTEISAKQKFSAKSVSSASANEKGDADENSSAEGDAQGADDGAVTYDAATKQLSVKLSKDYKVADGGTQPESIAVTVKVDATELPDIITLTKAADSNTYSANKLFDLSAAAYAELVTQKTHNVTFTADPAGIALDGASYTVKPAGVFSNGAVTSNFTENTKQLTLTLTADYSAADGPASITVTAKVGADTLGTVTLTPGTPVDGKTTYSGSAPLSCSSHDTKDVTYTVTFGVETEAEGLSFKSVTYTGGKDSTTKNTGGGGTSVGVGASFAFNYINTDTLAIVGAYRSLKSGTLAVLTELQDKVKTAAVSGSDPLASASGTGDTDGDGNTEDSSKVQDISVDASIAIGIITNNVQAFVAGNADVETTGGDTVEVKPIPVTPENTGITLDVTTAGITLGGLLASDDDGRVTYAGGKLTVNLEGSAAGTVTVLVDGEAIGTLEITYDGTEYKGTKTFTLDDARNETGRHAVTFGCDTMMFDAAEYTVYPQSRFANLAVFACQKGATTTRASGFAVSGGKAGVGAAVTVNIVADNVSADFAGSGTAAGTAVIDAQTENADTANAIATSVGSSVNRYLTKYKNGVTSAENFINNGDTTGATGEKTPTQTNNENNGTAQTINGALNNNADSSSTQGASTDQPLSTNIMNTQNVQASSDDKDGGAAAGSGEDAEEDGKTGTTQKGNLAQEAGDGDEDYSESLNALFNEDDSGSSVSETESLGTSQAGKAQSGNETTTSDAYVENDVLYVTLSATGADSIDKSFLSVNVYVDGTAVGAMLINRKGGGAFAGTQSYSGLDTSKLTGNHTVTFKVTTGELNFPAANYNGGATTSFTNVTTKAELKDDGRLYISLGGKFSGNAANAPTVTAAIFVDGVEKTSGKGVTLVPKSDGTYSLTTFYAANTTMKTSGTHTVTFSVTSENGPRFPSATYTVAAGTFTGVSSDVTYDSGKLDISLSATNSTFTADKIDVQMYLDGDYAGSLSLTKSGGTYSAALSGYDVSDLSVAEHTMSFKTTTAGGPNFASKTFQVTSGDFTETREG